MKPWDGWEIEPVKWWFVLRCWLLHWWRHTLEWEDNEPVWVGVRYCPKCKLVLRVASHDSQGDTDG